MFVVLERWKGLASDGKNFESRLEKCTQCNVNLCRASLFYGMASIKLILDKIFHICMFFVLLNSVLNKGGWLFARLLAKQGSHVSADKHQGVNNIFHGKFLPNSYLFSFIL